MRKQVTFLLLLLLTGAAASAQVLFTISGDTVSTASFLKAYQKNNTASQAKQSTSVRDYLELYINSRLKIREAKSEGYDTLPQLVADLQNLRMQIMPGYLNEESAIEALLSEAFRRSQKDVRIAHIFIAYNRTGIPDTAAALSRMAEVSGRLQKGEPFASVAARFSDDTSAKVNGGDIGYITAFTLPYELENLAYNTPAGKLSGVYRSKAGLHLFRNLGERKAVGTMRAAQILLAFPPGATAAEEAAIKKRADSIYNAMRKGADFGKLATQFSNDVISAASGGQIAEFGTGQYAPAFEQQAFALLKDGDISKPFRTAHGWHIVKRISRSPVPSGTPTPEAREQMLEKINASDRMTSTRASLVARARNFVSFRKGNVAPAALWVYTDSVLNFKAPAFPPRLNDSTILFQVGNRNVMVSDWTSYARTFRYRNDGSGIKPYPELWEEFEQNTTLDHYKENLEAYIPEFKAQISEFRDGNLFFEIMQRKVWGPAQTDSQALENFFKAHVSRYHWKKSADAVVFYTSDATVARNARATLARDPRTWRSLVNTYNDKLAVDSNRFELDQIPGQAATFRAGLTTPVVANKTDRSFAFAYIVKLYPAPEPRTFAEARGLVINDYQDELEKAWIAELRRKYPVQVNEVELRKLVN